MAYKLDFMSENYPSAAFILSLIAGLFVILGGLVVAAVAAAFTFFAYGIGAIVGLFGIIWGVIILVGAFNLRSNPRSHGTWGAIILVFSLISWFGAFGGFLIGFLLGLIGGIMAITWEPAQLQPQPVPTYSAPTYSPPPTYAQPSNQAARFCPNCGAPVDATATFCPHCGKQLPQ